MDNFPTWVEIDLDAFKWNLERIRERVPGVSILLVVKADAYGHGAIRISRFAVECGVDMLGVATVDEGVQLRKAGITIPVLVLSPTLENELEKLIDNDLSASVSTVGFAESAAELARKKGKTCRVHIEVDTGMGRAGLAFASALESVRRICELENLEAEGIFTHFPAADSDEDYTRDQIRMFTGLVGRLSEQGISFRYVHAANSAAVINFPSSHFNMIRPGLSIYGHTPSVGLKDRVNIVPVLSFKTRLLLVRKFPAGSSISYGRTYITERETAVGTIPVGYGHGICHRLSNRGEVLFRQQRVPIIGRVTMDMTMIDLTGFENPMVGEEVVIFGRQAEKQISVDEVAEWDGTLNYEVLTRISKRVVRVYIKSGKVDTLKTLYGVKENP